MSHELEERTSTATSTAMSTADIAAAADYRREQLVQVETQRGQTQVPPMPRNEMDGRGAEQLAPLFDRRLADEMRGRWTDIQSSFVDDPHRAVQDADELVAKALQDLARSFAQHRAEIEQEARGGDQEPSTENLRVALRRYRSFFERLLSL
jgi:hypothetical protein